MSEPVRIYHIPPCRMVSSGSAMFGDGRLEEFSEWFSRQPRSLFPQDFLWFDGEGFIWYFLYQEGMTVPAEYEIVDFPGGLYAVATGKDGDNQARTSAMEAIEDFLRAHPRLKKDPARSQLGNIITPPEAGDALGYEQMDYYVPVRLAECGRERS